MIVDKQTLAYRNVVSKIFEGPHSAADKMFEDMFELVDQYGLTPQGNYFYTILNDVRDEELIVMEISIPVKENMAEFDDDSGLVFRSFYFLKNLLMQSIVNDFENKGLGAYEELTNYIYEKEMIQRTPIINEFNINNDDREIMNVYVGADNNPETQLENFLKKIESENINQF